MHLKRSSSFYCMLRLVTDHTLFFSIFRGQQSNKATSERLKCFLQTNPASDQLILFIFFYNFYYYSQIKYKVIKKNLLFFLKTQNLIISFRYKISPKRMHMVG